jgi:short subunit dehydrogenase-like uncharacterized protein
VGLREQTRNKKEAFKISFLKVSWCQTIKGRIVFDSTINGVHYADITGVTFVRTIMITEHDTTAQQSGAIIIPHYGNDCIPQDLTVFELHQYAKNHGNSLQQVLTCVKVHQDVSLLRGTAAAAELTNSVKSSRLATTSHNLTLS